MVGITGLIRDRTSNSIYTSFKVMLNTSKHRGICQNPTSLETESYQYLVAFRSNTNIDYSLSDKSDELEILCGWDIALNASKKNTPKELQDYLLLNMTQSGFKATRHRYCQIPLFYGWLDTNLHFANERKSLWAAGIAQVSRLNPGQTLNAISCSNHSVFSHNSIEKPTITKSTKDKSIRILIGQLDESFRRIERYDKAALLFSGGVDSSLAALLTKAHSVEPTLFTACSESSYDRVKAQDAADILIMKQVICEFDQETLWKVLPQVMYAIESAKRMDVEIAMPFFLASSKAQKQGFSLAISGQGPDELFAGYSKHIKTFRNRGPGYLKRQLWDEVSKTFETNIERDEKAIAYNKLDAFFPYLHSGFVKIALSLPVEWKVTKGETFQRKVIFRKLAMTADVPLEIAESPKKATQYSSGARKLLVDAVKDNVKEIGKVGKRKASSMVQSVLNQIAIKIGMPVDRKITQKLSIDMEPTERLLDQLNKSANSAPQL